MSKQAHSDDVSMFQIDVARWKEEGNLPRQWRKRPVVIDAVHFDGSGASCEEVTAFFGGSQQAEPNHVWKPRTNSGGHICTLEGNMEFVPGDWIIKGVNGEFYPCKPDIFAKTYEPVL